MNILGIDHIQLAIPVDGEQLGRAFYCGILGFKEVPKPIELAAKGGTWFEAGNLHLHLGVDPDFQPATKAHPGILVSDLEALIDKLAAHKIPVKRSTPVAGSPRIFTSDPFGNRLEFTQKSSAG